MEITICMVILVSEDFPDMCYCYILVLLSWRDGSNSFHLALPVYFFSIVVKYAWHKIYRFLMDEWILNFRKYVISTLSSIFRQSRCYPDLYLVKSIWQHVLPLLTVEINSREIFVNSSSLNHTLKRNCLLVHLLWKVTMQVSGNMEMTCLQSMSLLLHRVE